MAVQDRPFPYKMVKGVADGCEDFCKRRMKGVPEFSDISVDDQRELFAANVPLLVFQEAGCIDEPDSGLTKGIFSC